MQAIAVFTFAIFALVFVVQADKNCHASQADRELGIKCMNETKEGKCDFEMLMVDPNYLSEKERNDTLMCFAKEKNYISSEGKLNEDVLRQDTQKLNATDDARARINEALDDCIEANKAAESNGFAILHCTTIKGIKICNQ